MLRVRIVASIVICAALVAPASSAWACSLDGVPSVSANGLLAVRNLAVPRKADFLTWSPFVFRHPFGRSTVIRLSEDRAKVARALGPTSLHARWRWTFGDGKAAEGAGVTHHYAHAGRYRIIVAAYDASTKQWFPFDSVEVTVQA